MDKYEELAKRIEYLEMSADNEKRGHKAWLYIMEKLLLPLALAVLTFTIALGTQRISAGQLELAEVQAKAANQLKYLELFYSDINDSKKPDRQMAALTLLYIIDRDVGSVLAKAVAANVDNDEKVKDSANTLAIRLKKTLPLVNYKVYFYYMKNDDWANKWVNFYTEKLGKFNLIPCEKREITENDWHKKLDSPNNFEIRYDDIYETEAAEALDKLLQEFDTNNSFTKRIAGGRTPNVLTVFFRDPGKAT